MAAMFRDNDNIWRTSLEMTATRLVKICVGELHTYLYSNLVSHIPPSAVSMHLLFLEDSARH